MTEVTGTAAEAAIFGGRVTGTRVPATTPTAFTTVTDVQGAPYAGNIRKITAKPMMNFGRKGGEYMTELSHWNEITKGLYRYVIAANCCYEIHILYHENKTDILKAKASLYIVGNWYSSKEDKSFFERECLLSEQSLCACLQMAKKDNEENME